MGLFAVAASQLVFSSFHLVGQTNLDTLCEVAQLQKLRKRDPRRYFAGSLTSSVLLISRSRMFFHATL